MTALFFSFFLKHEQGRETGLVQKPITTSKTTGVPRAQSISCGSWAPNGIQTPLTRKVSVSFLVWGGFHFVFQLKNRILVKRALLTSGFNHSAREGCLVGAEKALVSKLQVFFLQLYYWLSLWPWAHQFFHWSKWELNCILRFFMSQILFLQNEDHKT